MEQHQDKRCTACGGALECKVQGLSIGADGRGGLMSLLYQQYDVDVYACPACGKVELYTHSPVTILPERDNLVTCPECGAKHSPLINCPSCALRTASRRSLLQKDSPSKKKEARPPWEQ